MSSFGHDDNSRYDMEAPLSPTSRTRLPPPPPAYYEDAKTRNRSANTMSESIDENSRYGMLESGKKPPLAAPPAYSETKVTTRNRFDSTKEDKGMINNNLPPVRQISQKDQFKFPEENMKHIDYVLVYKNKTLDEFPANSTHSDPYIHLKKKIDMRNKFYEHMVDETLEMQEDVIGEDVYVKIHVPLKRLCQEAETINLEMPLDGMANYDDDQQGCIGRWEDKIFKTDDEVDFVSAPFDMDLMHKFSNNEDADLFFRPALRCFLTHHILINIDIRNTIEEEEDPFAKKGLPYLRMKNVYIDGFILHDETLKDPSLQEDIKEYKAKLGSQFLINTNDEVPDPDSLLNDCRHELNETWATRWFKYQPLWKIRNYFGEKVALYFAWSGALIVSLWIPTFLGLGIFFYGLNLSIRRQLESTNSTLAPNATFINEVTDAVENSINVLKESFDNECTPYFAVIICLWGTLFLEYWKRRNATLAYEWDVNSFEDSEPDRPEFFGTTQRQNPVIPEELEWIYPIYKQLAKYALSFSVLVVMVCCVFIAAASVVLYRVFMTVDYCTSDWSAAQCLVVATLASSVMQAVTIMILGKIYDKVAVVLTNWENHRTLTQYNDALIIKLFAFQFANSYTSLFYIAFFRGIVHDDGLFGLGPEYQDSCGTSGNCMAMLSLQVLVLMLAKPAPKFLKDVLLVFLKKMWRRYIKPCLARCCKCCPCFNKVDVKPAVDEIQAKIDNYMHRERLKPELGDFTLGEYTEKIIVYGFLMLFSASLPLAPLIALLVNWLDMRIDARRMLWWYRRPVAYIAQDLGMWYAVLQFLNLAGVVTNGFLIAFTSAWGSQYTMTQKLWIVIGFEHIVLTLMMVLKAIVPDIPRPVRLSMRRHIVLTIKFILAAIIPDVPKDIELSMKREKYQVGRILADKTLTRAQSAAAASSYHAKSANLKINKTTFPNQFALPPLASNNNNGDVNHHNKGPHSTDTTVMQLDNEFHDAQQKKHKKHKKKHRKSSAQDPLHTASGSLNSGSVSTISDISIQPPPAGRPVAFITKGKGNHFKPHQEVLIKSSSRTRAGSGNENLPDLESAGYSTAPADTEGETEHPARHSDNNNVNTPQHQQSGTQQQRQLPPKPTNKSKRHSNDKLKHSRKSSDLPPLNSHSNVALQYYNANSSSVDVVDNSVSDSAVLAKIDYTDIATVNASQNDTANERSADDSATASSNVHNHGVNEFRAAYKAKRMLASKYGTLKYNPDGSHSIGFGEKFPDQQSIKSNFSTKGTSATEDGGGWEGNDPLSDSNAQSMETTVEYFPPAYPNNDSQRF